MAIPFTHLEQDAITALKTRLRQLFADVPPERVEESVERAHHRFDDSRIRQYVPLLVEHAAREDLSKN